MTNFLWYIFIAGLLICLFGLINILFPIKSLGIRSRRRALLVAFVGLVIASAFSHLWHYSLPPEEKAKIEADASARDAAKQQRKAEFQEKQQEPKVYSSGTLLAFAEGNTGWVGIGSVRTGSVSGIALPAFSNFGYAVQIDNILYIGKCTSLFHTKKTLRDFIVGDSVQTRLDGDHLYIVAQNGKEIRLKVVQRQRI
jgi:hypothetical protein